MSGTPKTTVVHCRKSKYDVYIGRPSKWGNEYVLGRDGGRDTVIARHKARVLSDPAFMEMIKRELKGKVLGCFCSPLPCHGDVLAAIANEE